MNSIVLLEHTVKLLKTTPRFKNNPMLDYRFLRGNYWWGMHRFPSASSIAYLFIFLSVDSFISPLASLSSRISFFCYQSSAARFLVAQSINWWGEKGAGGISEIHLSVPFAFGDRGSSLGSGKWAQKIAKLHLSFVPLFLPSYLKFAHREEKATLREVSRKIPQIPWTSFDFPV